MGCRFLGVFYWMLLNIHPAYRSTLHSIQLLSVVNSTFLKTYGIDAVMKPAVSDLKKLSTEVCVRVYINYGLTTIMLYNVRVLK